MQSRREERRHVMTAEGYAQRRKPLSEEDPLPPEDRLTDELWRADVEALYRQRAQQLIRHFASTMADRDTARDVVHEGFAKLSGLSFPRRLFVARLDAYLYRICANLVRDRGRISQSREQFGHDRDNQDQSHDALLQLEHRDTLRRLELVMLRLKPKTREIFLAKRLDGMTYAEIAKQTGLSVKGVEKHMSKAIAMLDRAMDRDRP